VGEAYPWFHWGPIAILDANRIGDGHSLTTGLTTGGLWTRSGVASARYPTREGQAFAPKLKLMRGGRVVTTASLIQATATAMPSQITFTCAKSRASDCVQSSWPQSRIRYASVPSLEDRFHH
jgi:hypothetical protein